MQKYGSSENAFYGGAENMQATGQWGLYNGWATDYISAANEYNSLVGDSAHVTTNINDGYIQTTAWYRDAGGNGATVNGNSAYGIIYKVGMSASDGTPERKGVGQLGELESLIPVWGSGRAAIDHFQNGEYWRGLAYTALAVSDVFLVESVAKGIGKGAWKLGSHSWSATRKWMVNKGYAGAGEPLHHWAITQAIAKKYGLEAVSDQPWNLVKFSNQSIHIRAGHGLNYLGQPGYSMLGQFWHGTPTWFKAGVVSVGGRSVN